MVDNKKMSRKDFLKYLLGTLFTVVCVFKLPNVNFAGNNVESNDSNDIKY